MLFRRCSIARFKVAAPREVHGTPTATHRRRRFTTPSAQRGSSSPVAAEGSAAHRPTRHAFIPPQRAVGGRAVGRALGSGESPSPVFEYFPNVTHTGTASQRQRFRAQQTDGAERGSASATEAGVDVAAPASYLTPLPRSYGFYDGIDAHGLEAPRPSPELRQRMLRNALEEQAASVVEFTEGGEADIELGGLPESEYHGQAGWTTIPRDSALYSSVIARDALESRQRLNSWGVARRQERTAAAAEVGRLLGEYAPAADAHRASSRDGQAVDDRAEVDATDTLEEHPEALDGPRRRRRTDEAAYSSQLEGEMLEPTPASIGSPRSVYGLRKLFVQGLLGYQGIISRAEEAQMAEELLQLLQDPRAAYVAEEARYCVNLYESELGVPGSDTLAFAMRRAPTLQRVLYRFYLLGLVPAPPNVVQVSEMVGNFSGYPVHRKPRAIGPYVGLLNLVSTTVMHMQHRDCPWYPRLHMNPRSLFVMTEPCLSEYAMGYKWTHQPFHAFEYATRVSKDYRIEVLFACVETEHMPHLNEAVQLTEYATARLGDGGAGGAARSDGPGSSSTDTYLEQLRHRLHARSEGARAGGKEADDACDGRGARANLPGHPAEEELAMVDGAALRTQLQARGAIGQKTHVFTAAAAASPLPAQGEGSGSAPAPAPAPAAASAARRRLAALKARHDFAKRLRAETVSRQPHSGPQLIRGHSPADRQGL